MQLKIGYLFQCPPWARSFCPFRACPNVPPTASRCTANCVPMYPQLRPDVPPTTSRRIAICVGTQMVVRRDAVLGASGAQLLAMWVSWWIEGKAKM